MSNIAHECNHKEDEESSPKIIGMIQGNTEYHANPAIGSTTLKGYMDNPIKAFKSWKGEIEMKKTQALIDGSLIHCLTLEPETFDDEFFIDDYGMSLSDTEKFTEIEKEMALKQTKIYPIECLTPSGTLSLSKKVKELISSFKEENGDCVYLTPNDMKKFGLYIKTKGRQVITQDKYDEAMVVAKKALEYEFQMTTNEEKFTFTLQDAISHDSAIMERAFYAWYDPLTKEVSLNKSSAYCIRLKTKPDILLDVGNGAYVVIDLKTAVDASPSSFRKGGNFFYHLQEQHYTKVLEANGLMIYKFKFLFVGKEKWSTAQDYEYDQPSKELGEDQFYRALKQHELALTGEVRETTFDGKEYDREPVIGLPNYLFYLD